MSTHTIPFLSIKKKIILNYPKIWTDAWCPVPRLWIRSAGVGGDVGEWEHNNNSYPKSATLGFFPRDSGRSSKQPW